MIIHGDCLETLKTLEDNSIDAVVTDPPYGLSFMGKKWDYDVPSTEIWQECLRVLKPGGYLLAFAGTRTQHRMAVRIEDAGFEIRDMIAWVYGSGFPKSLNIANALAKRDGAKRDGAGTIGNTFPIKSEYQEYTLTDTAKQWEGWGTALKPALEPITVARKPLIGTVAENVLTHGTGGLNIDGCRVGTDDALERVQGSNKNTSTPNAPNNGWKSEPQTLGRFPANLIHDGSEEVVGLFPTTGASKASKRGSDRNGDVYGKYGLNDTVRGHDDNGGSAARFFYCAKASKKERNLGCEELEEKRHSDREKDDGVGGDNPRNRTNTPKQNFHPTVKPIALMEYLVKLVSREGATVLDPFVGSGTTGIACKNLNRQFIGIEREEDYVKIANARINA